MADNFAFTEGTGKTGAAKDVGGVLYPEVMVVEADGSASGVSAKLGSLTETAPTTDTASSGLNGRLQRIAQRLTTLVALVPAALTGSGNFKVSLQESNATQAISAASLPLPTGAAADATLTGGTQKTKITNGTQEADTVAGSLGQNVLLTAGARKQVTFTTTTAQAVASTDVSNYRWASVQITSQGTGSTVTFQGSNDNTNWTSVSLLDAEGSSGPQVLTSAPAPLTGFFSGPMSFRYFRLNVTGIASGTTAGTIQFFSIAPPALTNSIAVEAFAADGDITVLGFTDDAKSTATGNTSVSAMSVWKQISASVQAIATSIAGTLTVATHAVTQSGTWTVQPGNTANTTAWKVDGSAVTQPVSLASVPSHAVTNAGTFPVQATVAAGATNIAKAEDVASADADVGVPAMGIRKATPANTSGTDGDYEMIQMSAGRVWVDASGKTLTVDGSGVTQPISAASLPLPALAATSTKQSDGTQKTQIVDGSGNVIGATSNAIDVNIKSGAAAGTQYTEDAAAAADPVGNMLIARRKDTLSTSEVSADGDNIALNSTNKGQLHVKLADTVTVDGSGVTQPVSAASLPLPSGAATSAKQPALGTAGSASADVISIQGVASMTAVKVDGSAVTQPVSLASVPSHAVTNAGTFAVQATEADGANTTLGSKADAKSTATDTTAITIMSVLKQVSASVQAAASSLAGTLTVGTHAVTQSGTWTVQPGNTANTTAWKVDGSAVTQPVSGTVTANAGSGTMAVSIATNTPLGTVAHDGVDSGAPIKVGGRARSSEVAAVSSDDRSDFVTDLVGKQIVLPYANPENFVSGTITSAMTSTTSTSLVAAPAAGLRNYITQITVSNSHATVGTNIEIQDGSGGTTIYVIPAAAVYGGATITFPTPLRQPTTATALYCKNSTTGANTFVSASGYKGA